MPKPTPTATDASAGTRPFAGLLNFPLPAGAELYDQLMSKIEPELTSSVVETLEEKYKDETPEQAKERAERYAKAFLEYEKQFQEYVNQLQEAVRSYKHAAVSSAEKRDRATDVEVLGDIEKSINAD